MKYKVHRLAVKKDMDMILEDFINKLDGEVIAVTSHIKPTFLPMGATAKVDYLLITERVS